MCRLIRIVNVNNPEEGQMAKLRSGKPLCQLMAQSDGYS